MTRTSKRSDASVLKSLSYTRLPSLVVGWGSWLSFRAWKTAVDGRIIRRRPFLCIPIMASSNPGGSSPLPTVQAISLNSVSAFVVKYLTPPGSLAVEKDWHRIDSSAAILEPFSITGITRKQFNNKGTSGNHRKRNEHKNSIVGHIPASPFPSRYSRYSTPDGSFSYGTFTVSVAGRWISSICRRRWRFPLASPSTL